MKLILSALCLIILSCSVAFGQQTLVGDRAQIGGPAPAQPVNRTDGAVIRQRAPGATKYVSDWFVDSQVGSTFFDSYDTVGGVYTPFILRSLSLTVEAPTSITGTLTVSDNANFSGWVGHPDFASQVQRWRITNEGAADFRFLYADEMHVKKFVADLEQALAGGQIIAKSVAILAADFRCPATPGLFTMTVKDLPGADNMQVFEVNDFVLVRSFARASGELIVGDCIGTVESPDTSGNGTQTWVFRRPETNAGTMPEGTIVPADGLALDFGVSGNGYYEVSAVDGIYGSNAPYAQIVTWTNTPAAANRTIRARFGRLNGITGDSTEYGMIAGVYAATNGQFFRASNVALELHGVNFLMWEGANTVFKIDRTAPSLALGNPVPSAYSSGTGIWMGNDAGTYKFRAGVPGGQGVFWDGLNFAINGSITAFAGTIGGWDITATALTATTGTVGMSSATTGGDDVRFWAGSATPTSAPFRVTEAGALVASNATITGALTATSGDITAALTAGSITTTHIAANTITADDIAANAIEATEIAAGAVTAAKISVSTLSAISADIGTVTAGTIDGAEAFFGASNAVTLNSSGITIDAGSGNSNKIKFSDGSEFFSDADVALVSADTRLQLRGGVTAIVNLTGSTMRPQNDDAVDLGDSSLRWRKTYTNDLRINNLSGTGNDYACLDANGDLFRSDTAC